ncbi:hypothetical protein HYV73_04235 [Candidatus Uhrbacteria bacterium]|nr:hypothetical protein [Candidatus Uhrbacteria bacterium]
MESLPIKLEQLFGSKTRAQLLWLFLDHPEQAFFVRELTRRIHAQLNSVRRELKNLIELGVVVERLAVPSAAAGGAKLLSEKKRFYAANPASILFDDLKALFKKVRILLRQHLVSEIEQHGSVEYVAFMGKFIDETSSATDLIIVGSVDPGKVKQVVKVFEDELGSEINYTYMPKDEFLYRRQVTDRFLSSLLDAKKVVVLNKLGI